jgi:hypothetical protein
MDKLSPLTEHLEQPEKENVSQESEIVYSEAEVRQIKRKLDVRLCVMVAVMYTICQIDRNNLANACVPCHWSCAS